MNGVTLGTGLTVNDITTKTGYSLSGTQTFNLTGSITGRVVRWARNRRSWFGNGQRRRQCHRDRCVCSAPSL
jgi:hypothetical protein